MGRMVKKREKSNKLLIYILYKQVQANNTNYR